MIRNLQFKEITYAQLDKDRKRNAVHKGVERCSPGPNWSGHLWIAYTEKSLVLCLVDNIILG